MPSLTLAHVAVGLYVLGTIALTIRGMRRTRSLKGFAVGNRDIPAALVGLSLTAQLTSVATFVINPGLVFHYGVAGLLGLGVAAAAGITTGLVVFSARFRRTGSQVAALTVPGWIGARYGSGGLRALFSTLSLGLVAYAVLIVVALSLVLAGLLGVSPGVVAVALVGFVLAYVMLGGANTHAYTNALQALVMLAVALVLIGSGLALLRPGGVLTRLAAEDPALVAVVNPSSLYFRNLFEVFVCNALVGLALVCQPHIVSKVLYLRDDRQVRTFLGVAVAAGLVFLGVLVTGLYARAVVPVDTPIDRVIPTYIAASFSPTMQVVISIGMLCAGLSTLEGILLALSSIASIDVYPMLAKLAGRDGADERAALRFGRLAMVAVGVATVWLTRHQLANPTGGSVAIFAQYGVYLLFTASFLPLACGMFLPSVTRPVVAAGALVAIAVYGGVAALELTPMHNNPAFLATCGMGAGWGAVALGMGLRWLTAAPGQATGASDIARVGVSDA